MWHLLSGDEATIRRVTSAAGFSYRWDERTGQFAHVSGILAVTPKGGCPGILWREYSRGSCALRW